MISTISLGLSLDSVLFQLEWNDKPASLHFGSLAHRVEQGTFNPKVPGSSPGRPTSFSDRCNGRVSELDQIARTDRYIEATFSSTAIDATEPR